MRIWDDLFAWRVDLLATTMQRWEIMDIIMKLRNKKEENSSKVRGIRFIAIILYILSFVIWDRYNVVPLLGAYCLYKMFLSFDQVKKKDMQRDAERREKLYVLCIMGGEIFFSYVFRFKFSEYYDFGSISIGEFNLIPTFIFWIELGAVLVYYRIFYTGKVFILSKKVVLFAVLVVLPFIYSTVLSLLSLKINGIEVINMTKVDCLNSFYRAFILAGFTEELFYRGLIYDGLKGFFQKNTAIILQATFFSLIHSRQMVLLLETGDINIVINFICVFWLGVVSAKIKDLTDSFLPSILLHGCLNGGIYYLGLFLIQ